MCRAKGVQLRRAFALRMVGTHVLSSFCLVLVFVLVMMLNIMCRCVCRCVGVGVGVGVCFYFSVVFVSCVC